MSNHPIIFGIRSRLERYKEVKRANETTLSEQVVVGRDTRLKMRFVNGEKLP